MAKDIIAGQRLFVKLKRVRNRGSVLLGDFVKLVKHFWYLIVLVPLAFAAITVFYALMPENPEYEATAVLTPIDPSGTVSTSVMLSTARSVADDVLSSYTDSEIKVDASEEEVPAGMPASDNLIFCATGDNALECVSVVNALAAQVADSSRAIYAEIDADERKSADEELARRSELFESLKIDNPEQMAGLLSVTPSRSFAYCDFVVSEANEAVDVHAAKSPTRLVLFASLAGFFMALGIIILISLLRQPLISVEDIERLSGLTVLARVKKGSSADLLWVNASSHYGFVPSKVALVPLSRYSAMDSEIESLATSILSSCGKEGPADAVQIVECNASFNSASSVYAAKGADLTILCVRLWRDSAKGLREVLAERKIAAIAPMGIVVLSD